MKRISLIAVVILNFAAYSQFEHTEQLIIEGFKKFPEEVFHDSYGELSKKDRSDIINYYTSVNQNDSASSLIKFEGTYGDIGVYYEIKGFVQDSIFLIGYVNKFSTFSTIEAGIIYFFQYVNSKLIDITSSILESFNYFTDNFKKVTIDSLNSHYCTDLRKTPFHTQLLFNFSKSDSISIKYDFLDYIYMRDKKPPGLNECSPYFDGQFYTKKYIMKNEKLRLAE